MSASVRIIGIDPGTAIVGWAVIDVAGAALQCVACGVITTAPQTPAAVRLAEIARDLDALLQRYTPQEAAVERLFYAKNQTTVIPVAQARGVILAQCARRGIPVHAYSPPQVKQAVTGYGGAPKAAVQKMVTKIFALATVPQPDDAADALAVAMCHSAQRTSLQAATSGTMTV